MAYLIDGVVATEIFARLDHREQNGYERHQVELTFREGDRAEGIVYIASRDNEAYLGPAPLPKLAAQIKSSAGPSGANLDYVMDLADALRRLDIHDDHVFELEKLVNGPGAAV